MTEYKFRKAIPVWERGKDTEKNYNLIFRAIVEGSDNTVIAISAASMYQMFVNGDLVSEGPARAGHGYVRVDEIDITKWLKEGRNVVCIYVDGYYTKNFYLLKQPSFLCAEIIRNGKVIGYTGDRTTFEAKYHSGRTQKVPRVSFQRTYMEYYNLTRDYLDIETDPDYKFDKVKLAFAGMKSFITREVPYPSYEWVGTEKLISKGTFTFDRPDPDFHVAWEPAKGFEYFPDMEVKVNNNELHEHITSTQTERCDISPDNNTIGANCWALYKMKSERTGFITLEIEAEENSAVMVLFDEICTDDDLLGVRMQSPIIWKVEAGKYRLMANEPQSLMYVKVFNLSDGNLKVNKIGIHEYEFALKAQPLNSGDERLDRIYNAAVETFRQNTIDIYMDCPSRERAGWLCDSFFTSRVEKVLTGKSEVEHNFLENFVMQKGMNDIDERMIPMCYPSDHCDGNFIPNWAMWCIIELGEYFVRSGDRELVDEFENRVYRLLDYFNGFENSDGLVERFEKWVFVEWSKANDFIYDVNYPTNMLYAKMLNTVADLYGDEACRAKSSAIMAKVREQSYFDGFFHDHGIRQADGTLVIPEKDVTETCQYYAFFTKCATPDTYPELWRIMRDEFGADRVEKGLHPEIYPSNAFIGYYLRLEMLAEAGEKDTVLENIIGFFDKMATTTGTLWENNNSGASCNHGFASHVIVWLDKFARKA